MQIIILVLHKASQLQGSWVELELWLQSLWSSTCVSIGVSSGFLGFSHMHVHERTTLNYPQVQTSVSHSGAIHVPSQEFQR